MFAPVVIGLAATATAAIFGITVKQARGYLFVAVMLLAFAVVGFMNFFHLN
jgi:hypothetical protein